MPTPINLLDTNLGIQDILTPQDTGSMPLAQQLPQTALREAGVEELFNAVTTDKIVERNLTPSTGDGTILTPAIFSDAIANVLEILKDNKNPDVRSFVHGELKPLMDNKDLMQAYIGLLIGG